ncbi:helix-turn-helix transcriptional regulator [Streptomyces chrestomyceticus]|uniref:helix-turn-helix transcriptional regulator n=1 Tax=Streptomyces chrestomyceticus TaxID=68185 RepID=UPI0033F1C517
MSASASNRPSPVEFSSTEPEACRAFLDAAYGARLQVHTLAPGERITHCRYEVGAFTLDRMTLAADITYRSEPQQPLLVSDLQGKGCRLEHSRARSSECFGPGDVLLISQPDDPCIGRVSHARLRTVGLPPGSLAAAAAAAGLPEGPVRFTDSRPVSPDLAGYWKRAVGFVTAEITTHVEVAAQPLVVSGLTRLLATAALTAFPNTSTHHHGPAAPKLGDATPATVRRAVAFIDSHPDADIGLAEMAEAAHVSPRALQHAFRRHMDTTPTGYLRRVRLAYAHQDLVDATPGSGVTVTSVAGRWGFAHQGRFAASYRAAYGRTPQQTLRAT